MVVPESRRRVRADCDGVADVVGSMMLVGITVAGMSALALLVLAMPAPVGQLHAELAVETLAGPGGWGSGDEVVRLTHRGGEALDADNVRVLLTINGHGTMFEGVALGGGFADGRLNIGEAWHWAGLIQESDVVEVEVVAVEQNHLLARFVARS